MISATSATLQRPRRSSSHPGVGAPPPEARFTDDGPSQAVTYSDLRRCGMLGLGMEPSSRRCPEPPASDATVTDVSAIIAAGAALMVAHTSLA